jgi:serine/threonine protein kinase
MQCKGLTKIGNQCSREVKTEEYCWQHKNEPEVKIVPNIKESNIKPEIVSCSSDLNQNTPEVTKNLKDKSMVKLRFIGRGASSNVFLIAYKNRYIALKEIKKEDSILFTNEIYILKRLSLYPHFHPGIVGIYKYEKNPNIIYLEYLEGASLADIIKLGGISNLNLGYIFKTLISTLMYIHNKNIVHRDIKLDNIILSLESLKFIDFGLATLTNDKISIRGTPKFIAPEIWNYKKYANIEGLDKAEILKKADIYALGIVFYILVNGKHPYDGKCTTKEELSALVLKSGNIISKSGTNYDSVINKMLIYDYRKRIDLNDINLDFL